MTDRRREKLLPIARWPTAEEVAASRWFSPVRLGPVEALTRTWIPAMVPWRATDDGFVTDEVCDWYARFAKGRPGVLVVEATGIRDVPSGPLLRAGHERFVPGLTRLVERVREASGGKTRLLIQLIDFLAIKRRSTREQYLTRFLKLTDRHRAAVAAFFQADSRDADSSRAESRDGESSRSSRSTLDEDSSQAESRDGDSSRRVRSTLEPTHDTKESPPSPSLDSARDEAVRAALIAMTDEALAQVLDARELEALRMGLRERVTDLHLPHIAALPQTLPSLFAEAAARCEQAGFDGVELHFAHAYTMASFLSALNDRPDGYGGPRAQRVRLPLEVYRAVRARLRSTTALGCRFLADEIIPGGNRPDDAAYFAVELARAGMDFLSLSRGGKFEDAAQPKVGNAAYPYTGLSGAECMPTTRISPPGPFGRNVGAVAQVKRALVASGLATPVVTCGGIASFEQAEEILAHGDADIVASARQALADPDWFEKLRQGRGAEIRRCLFTNYCEGLDQSHKAVTCQTWDRVRGLSDDATAPRTKDGRRLTAPDWR